MTHDIRRSVDPVWPPVLGGQVIDETDRRETARRRAVVDPPPDHAEIRGVLRRYAGERKTAMEDSLANLDLWKDLRRRLPKN